MFGAHTGTLSTMRLMDARCSWWLVEVDTLDTLATAIIAKETGPTERLSGDDVSSFYFWIPGREIHHHIDLKTTTFRR